MGSSTSFDRHTQSTPEVTVNAVWEEQSTSEQKKVGTVPRERHQSHNNPRPERDYLDNLIKLHGIKPVQMLGGGTRIEIMDQNTDLKVRKQRRGHPKGEPQSAVFATTTTTSSAVGSRIEMLTKRVDELEKHQKVTTIQMEAIIVGKKTLETKLEAAIDRIQTLSKDIEKAKCTNVVANITRQQGKDANEISGNRKRNNADDGEENENPKAKNQRLVSES